MLDCSFVQRILIIYLHSFALPDKDRPLAEELNMVNVKMVRLVQVLIAIELAVISPVSPSQWL